MTWVRSPPRNILSKKWYSTLLVPRSRKFLTLGDMVNPLSKNWQILRTSRKEKSLELGPCGHGSPGNCSYLSTRDQYMMEGGPEAVSSTNLYIELYRRLTDVTLTSFPSFLSISLSPFSSISLLPYHTCIAPVVWSFLSTTTQLNATHRKSGQRRKRHRTRCIRIEAMLT
jgi:hypothetical protein